MPNAPAIRPVCLAADVLSPRPRMFGSLRITMIELEKLIFRPARNKKPGIRRASA
jgi:hypothetical protein